MPKPNDLPLGVGIHERRNLPSQDAVAARAGCIPHDPQDDEPEAVDVEVFGQMEETSVADPEGMNDRRSLAALMAVITFAQDQGEMPRDGVDAEERAALLQQNVVDLIADLMHLDDRMPFGFQSAITSAQSHYFAETEADNG